MDRAGRKSDLAPAGPRILARATLLVPATLLPFACVLGVAWIRGDEIAWEWSWVAGWWALLNTCLATSGAVAWHAGAWRARPASLAAWIAVALAHGGLLGVALTHPGALPVMYCLLAALSVALAALPILTWRFTPVATALLAPWCVELVGLGFLLLLAQIKCGRPRERGAPESSGVGE